MTSHSISFRNGGISLQQQDGDTVLRAALRAGVGLPYECNSGGCGSCRFELLQGEVEDLWPDAPGLSHRDRTKRRFLGCQCRPLSDIVIDARPGAEYKPVFIPIRRTARLVGTTDITHDIREFRFRSTGPAEFLPGQYAMLSIPSISLERAYSMSNIANPDGDWHFQIRHVPNGKMTGYLFNQLQIGGEVQIDGPFGLAWLRDDVPRDIVCVAGGSGLAPMISIARGASTSGLLRSRHLHFFYGGRGVRDLCADAILRRLPEFGHTIHYYPVASDVDANSTEAWHGATGFVHEEVKRCLGERMTEFEFYFAGPPPMTQALQEMLMVQFGVPFDQIYFDRFF